MVYFCVGVVVTVYVTLPVLTKLFLVIMIIDNVSILHPPFVSASETRSYAHPWKHTVYLVRRDSVFDCSLSTEVISLLDV